MTKVDAAAYVADMADQLRIIAMTHKLNVEAYLLDMVAMSARGSAANYEDELVKMTSSNIVPHVIHDEVHAAAG